MWRYTYNLHGLYETPSLPLDSDDGHRRRERAEAIIAGRRGARAAPS